MNRIFITSDTHFGHKKVIEFEPARSHYKTIEEHDEDMIARWNATVNKKDTVWHLGDVLFGRDTFAVLSRLNGIKKLVLGNHDKYPIELYMQHFSQIFGVVKLRDCVLSHVPLNDNQFYRFKANIHGHMHSKSIPDPRYFCVSVEQNELRPMLLDRVIHQIDRRLGRV